MFVWMYVLSFKTCPPGLCHNSFMATAALGHTQVRLHVVGFQNPKKAQVNNKGTSANIYIYTHTHTHTQ